MLKCCLDKEKDRLRIGSEGEVKRCLLALGIGADTPQCSAAERGVGAKARPEGKRPLLFICYWAVWLSCVEGGDCLFLAKYSKYCCSFISQVKLW